MWAFPCPWIPATPTRIVSLAPRTLPDDLVPAMVTSGNAVLAAAAVSRKPRRDMWLIGVLREKGSPVKTDLFTVGTPDTLANRASPGRSAGPPARPASATRTAPSY